MRPLIPRCIMAVVQGQGVVGRLMDVAALPIWSEWERYEREEVALADVNAIELRVPTVQHLRALWLEGLPDGGVFVPGLVSVPAAAPVIVRIAIEAPRAVTMFVRGTVTWRRLQAGASGPEKPASGLLLRSGTGIAFDATERPRLLFLERLERGAANEGRASSRYPSELPGELMVRDGERAVPIRVQDVGTHGARVWLPAKAYVDKSTPVRLWLSSNTSGASSFAPLVGQVSWVDRVRGDTLGVQLALGTKEDRLHWARVFRHCQHDFERLFVTAERRVG